MKQGIVVFALCAALLGGCATQDKAATPTTTATPASAQAAWQQRQSEFARMTSWRLQGRVGMQFRDPVSYTHLDVYKRQVWVFRQ